MRSKSQKLMNEISAYLEETDGWMECEKCGNVTQSMEHRQTVLIPLLLRAQSRNDNKQADRLAAVI